MADNQYKAGTYPGELILEKTQFGETEKGIPQMVLLVDIPDLGGTYSVSLFFSAESAPYSIPKLRAAGWKGADLSDLTGLEKAKVLVTLRYELYNGEQRMKLDLAGGGQFTVAKPIDQKAFAAKVKAITGAMGGAGGGPAASGGKEPPF